MLKIVRNKEFLSKKKKSQLPQDELVTVKSDLVLIDPDCWEEGSEVKGGGAAIEDPAVRGSRRSRKNSSRNSSSSSSSACRWLHGVPKCGLRALTLLLLLYVFVCSLNILSTAFRLIGGRTASAMFQRGPLLSSPVVGVMVGVVVTVLVQSSSTSSSIIVSMVAADFLDVKTAVPIIMGANIGTSLTNTLVSLGQAGDRGQFERSFSGAVVHDMFNWLCVGVLLPIEVMTGYLRHLSLYLLNGITNVGSKGFKVSLLSAITKPLTERIVKLDKKVLMGWSLGEEEYENSTLILRHCPSPSSNNESTSHDTETSNYGSCGTLAELVDLSDVTLGLLLLLISLLLLALCLMAIVKTLSSLLSGSVRQIVERIVNADLPYFPYLTGYLAIIVGAVLTFLLQSSSIFTSTLTPLVGMGVISIERMYPLTLGSNLGTTTTSIFAALSANTSTILPALQISLVHMLFNLSGILLWYPVPYLRFPIPLALKLGKVTAKYRWFAIVYILSTFCIVPLLVFVISLLGDLSYVVYLTLCLAIAVILVVNMCQGRCPGVLPSCMRTWDWLPLMFRSLDPYDKVMSRLMCCCKDEMDYGKDHTNTTIATTTTNTTTTTIPSHVVIVVNDADNPTTSNCCR